MGVGVQWMQLDEFVGDVREGYHDGINSSILAGTLSSCVGVVVTATACPWSSSSKSVHLNVASIVPGRCESSLEWCSWWSAEAGDKLGLRCFSGPTATAGLGHSLWGLPHKTRQGSPDCTSDWLGSLLTGGLALSVQCFVSL
jgi:hypothetical protein